MATILSNITPALNEAQNLPVFYERMMVVRSSADAQFECIVVDDHSADATWGVLRELAAREPRLRAIRLGRNSGTHTALACGLPHACGECVVVMAADLQDPPDTIPALLEKWRAGAKVVWAYPAFANMVGSGRA